MEFDTDKNGHLDRRELRQFLIKFFLEFSIRLPLTDDYCDSIFRALDADRSNSIELDELNNYARTFMNSLGGVRIPIKTPQENKTLKLSNSARRITNNLYDLAIDGDFSVSEGDLELNAGVSAHEMLQEVYLVANPATEMNSEDEAEDFMAAAFGGKEDREVKAFNLNNLEDFDDVYTIIKETSQSTYVHAKAYECIEKGTTSKRIAL
jgi:hypothetical protein